MEEKLHEGNRSSKKLFLSGVAIMTLSTTLVKVIGLIYKIPMLKYLGDVGMAYFNAAYDIYTMFYMISTAGLPVAISILISENRVHGNQRNIKKIFKVAVSLFFIIGVVGMLLMMLLSKSFSAWIKIDEAAYCIIAIAPTLLFICISSAIRGYFQGHQIMSPTAVSQVIEALGKLVIGLLLASYALKKGYSLPIVAAFAVCGLSIGTLASVLYLLISKLLIRINNRGEIGIDESGQLQGTLSITKRMIYIAIPITLSSSVMGITRLVDTALISRMLQSAGFADTLSKALYGNYSTLCVPIYNLPPAIITGISLSLVPMLTSAIEAKNKEKETMVLTSSLRVCTLFAMPCALGVAFFSKPILELLFFGEGKSVGVATPLLSILGASILFACLMNVSNAILQAYKQERKPIISMAVGALVKIVFDYLLIGNPKINIYGAPISTFLCNVTVMVINFYYIKKYSSEFEGIGKLFYRPLVSSVISVGGAFLIYAFARNHIGPSRMITIVSIGGAAVLYLVCAVIFKAVEPDDIKMLPAGNKLYGALKKMKIYK